MRSHWTALAAIVVAALLTGSCTSDLTRPSPTTSACDDVNRRQDQAERVWVMTDSCAAMITWVGPPRFYKSGHLIVLYVGRDEAVLGPLEAVLGKPFAGR